MYEVKQAREALVCPQIIFSPLFQARGDWDQTSSRNTCYNRTWKHSTAHKSFQRGRGLYQGNPFVCSVSDSHDSTIKAEILLTSTVIYYREKSGSRFNTNLTAITSTQLCAEEAWPSYPTGKEDRIAYGVLLLFLICHLPPHCLPISLWFYIYSFWPFSFLWTFVQEKEGKTETRGQTPPEGRIARQLPEIEICVFWDWQETEKWVVASLMWNVYAEQEFRGPSRHN